MFKKNILFILGLIFITIINLTVNSTDLFYLLLTFSLYLIFVSTFSNVKYNNKSNNLIFPTIITIILISIIYCILSYIIGSLFFKDIKYIFLSLGLTIFIYPSISIIKDYLIINKHKNKSKLISLIYYLISFISIIVILLLYHFTNIDLNILLSSIFIQQYFSFIIIIILNHKIFKIRKINIEQLKPIFTNNIRKTLITISNLFFYYISLIFLYFILINKYLYSYEMVSTLLVDVYFYSYYFIIFLSIIFYSDNIDKNINNTYIKLINKLLPITILISIISGPILLLLFNSNTNAYILTFLIFEPIFIIMYNIAMNMIIDKRQFKIILIISLLLKCITTIPLINSLYRMGYSMIYGDIISTILSLFIPIIITIIYINNIYKINFSNHFNSIISIIYQNIILCIILILLQLLVPLKTNNKIEAIGIITVYVITFVIFNYIKTNIRRHK